MRHAIVGFLAVLLLLACAGETQLMAPTAFTPDNDRSNDFYFLLSNCNNGLSFYNLRIYNRWGQLVFETDRLEDGWDGTFKGDRSPLDTYVFHATYVFEGENETRHIEGVLTLIR